MQTHTPDTSLGDLRTTEQVAAELGISARQVQALARARGVGARLGPPPHAILFTPADVDALRIRKVGRPPKDDTKANTRDEHTREKEANNE